MKNTYITNGDDTIIFLKQKDGSVHQMWIDTQDLSKVQSIPGTWVVQWNPCTKSYYAISSYRTGNGKNRKRKRILSHRFIMDCPDGLVVDHINHNTLDNRRKNLRIVTQQVNIQNRISHLIKNEYGIGDSKNWLYKFNEVKVNDMFGIYWSKARNYWIGRLRIKGMKVFEKASKDLELVKNEMSKAKERIHKEYIYKNVING